MEVKDNFDMYVGCKSGAFKGVRIEPEKTVMHNIQSLVSLRKNDEVTTMSWGDDEEKEVLVACGAKEIRSIKVYDSNCSTITSCFFCDVGTGSINGISRYDEAILTAVESGEVKLWKYRDEEQILIKAGENLKRMRHSRVHKKIIATGGYEHNLKLFDLEKQKQVFVEKNISHDWLQLRVPIWISDIQFLPRSERIVTVGRYGHVRLYDPKAQRRPVINLEMKDEALTTLSIMPRELQIMVGTGKGRMRLVDLRKPCKVLNSYKGFVGSVTGIACSTSEPYVVSVSLDRYLRVHHIDTKQLLKKIYLTSKISCMLLRSGFSLAKENEVNEDTRESTNRIEDLEEQENVKTAPDSDTDYDTLFDKMQVVGDEKQKTLMKKKRPSSVDDEIVFRKSSVNRTLKERVRPKKLKVSHQFIK